MKYLFRCLSLTFWLGEIWTFFLGGGRHYKTEQQGKELAAQKYGNEGYVKKNKINTPYLLTYSMEQSPSWEANRFSASHEMEIVLDRSDKTIKDLLSSNLLSKNIKIKKYRTVI